MTALFLLKCDEIIPKVMPFSYQNIKTKLKIIFSFRRYSSSKLHTCLPIFF